MRRLLRTLSGQALLLGFLLPQVLVGQESHQDEEASAHETRPDAPHLLSTAPLSAEGAPTEGAPTEGAPPADSQNTAMQGDQETQNPLSTIPEHQPPKQASGVESKGQSPQSPPTPQRSPGQLLRSLLTTSHENRIAGTAKSLADILQKTGPAPLSRHDQTARVRAYWDLSAAIAENALVQLDRIELHSLHAGITNPGSVWQQAFADTQARIHLTRRAALVAQYKLQQFLSLSQVQMTVHRGALPVPADHPHCGVYDTQYDQIFRDQPSEFAWQLHELLGNQYLQLLRQAVAVETATTRRQQASQQRSVQSDGVELLKAHENLRLQRHLFVLAVHTYNRTIADYTQLALPKSIKAQQLVTMLIYVKPSKQTTLSRQPEIERTGGDQELSTDSPAQSTNPKEHSILVRKR